MFVQNLAGRESHELGDRKYQHPLRDEKTFDRNLDTLPPGLSISPLFCLTIRPELWKMTQAGDGRLLFQADDYLDPSGSRTIALLNNHSDARVRAAAEMLATLIFSPPATSLSSVRRRRHLVSMDHPLHRR